MIKFPNIEEMLKAGMHFGHLSSKWHPKMKPYIFGVRQGVHVIDLSKTQSGLVNAMNYITQLVSENKNILLVGTKTQVKAEIKKTAIESKMPYVSERWLGGCLTNFLIVKNSIKKYRDLTEKKNSGKLEEQYTKKERIIIDREIAKLERNVGGLADLNRAPDAIFIWDIKVEATALTEAISKKIPVIAICDTNVNPEGVDYIIPSNDDASKAIKLVMKTISEAIAEGRKQAEAKQAAK